MRPFGAAFFWGMNMDKERSSVATDLGMSLIEVVLVLLVLAIVMTAALPNLGEMRGAAALGAVSSRLKGLLFRCRAYAILNSRATAVVFEHRADGSWRCFIAADGDGDGIRTRDIHGLIDPVVGEVLHLDGGGAGLGILQDEFVPDPSGRGRLRGDLADPVRAGRGDIITFTPRGTATPASIYLTDYRSRMRVLRVYGGTGRVISRVWKSGWPRWRGEGM
jgi:prepilin-type N-terminal cleavage/methylation domain-containing protein